MTYTCLYLGSTYVVLVYTVVDTVFLEYWFQENNRYHYDGNNFCSNSICSGRLRSMFVFSLSFNRISSGALINENILNETSLHFCQECMKRIPYCDYSQYFNLDWKALASISSCLFLWCRWSIMHSSNSTNYLKCVQCEISSHIIISIVTWRRAKYSTTTFTCFPYVYLWVYLSESKTLDNFVGASLNDTHFALEMIYCLIWPCKILKLLKTVSRTKPIISCEDVIKGSSVNMHTCCL